MSAEPTLCSTALALLALATPACVAVRYQSRGAPLGDPSSPAAHIENVITGDRLGPPGEHSLPDSSLAHPTVTRNGLENEGSDDGVERTVMLGVRVQAGSRADIRAMTWSPASAPRCAGGHPALDILLDDGVPNHALAPDVQVHWERPVVIEGGARVVTGRFDEDRPLLDQTSVVDLLMIERAGAPDAREICVRVPVTGPGVVYWDQKRWSLGGRLSFRHALAFTNASTLTFGVSGGRWVGPVRIGLEGIVGGTDDAGHDGPSGTGLCFIAPGPDCDNVWLGGGGLEASGIAWRWDRAAIGWSVAYETLAASIERLVPGAPALKRTAISGGPRLALQLLRVAPHIRGASPFGPTSAWGGELFVAAAQTWSGSASGSPVTVGVSLLGF